MEFPNGEMRRRRDAMGGALGMWRKEGEAEDRRGKGGGRGNRGPGRVAWGVAW